MVSRSNEGRSLPDSHFTINANRKFYEETSRSDRGVNVVASARRRPRDVYINYKHGRRRGGATVMIPSSGRLYYGSFFEGAVTK